MPVLHLALNDVDYKYARARAMEAGFPNIECYLLALLRHNISAPISAEVEAELLLALGQPGRELSPDDWKEKRRSLTALHQNS